jgi:large subunit ribosomal protein L10
MGKFAKEAKALEIKGGVVEGVAYDAAGIASIADIPGREELLAKLLGSMQSPIANFARVMQQLADKGGAGDAVAEAPAQEAPAAEETAEAPAVEETPAEEAPAEESAE